VAWGTTCHSGLDLRNLEVQTLTISCASVAVALRLRDSGPGEANLLSSWSAHTPNGSEANPMKYILVHCLRSMPRRRKPEHVGAGTCYWSPTSTQFTVIQSQYQSDPNSTTTLTNTGDPGCYSANGRHPQFIWELSMPNNTRPNFTGAPAFLFVRERNASDPAIVQIP
jgi:hypothetical protein